MKKSTSNKLVNSLLSLLAVLILSLFIGSSQTGIENIVTRVWAGAPPVHIENDNQLSSRQYEISAAIAKIDQANEKSPEYFRSLTKNIGNSTVSVIMESMDDFVQVTKNAYKKSTLTVQSWWNKARSGVDDMSVDSYNAVLDMGYAAEVSLKRRPIQLTLWITNFMLLGMILSYMVYAFIHGIFEGLYKVAGDTPIKKIMNFFMNSILKGIEGLLSLLPFGFIIAWLLESFIEFYAGSYLGFDKIIQAIYLFPDLTKNHQYEDGIIISVVVVSLLAIFWFVTYQFLAQQLEKVLPIKTCEACKRPFE